MIRRQENSSVSSPFSTSMIKAKDPSTIRLLGVCDSHFSPSTPPSYKIEYWDQCKDFLRQIRTFSQKNAIDAVVWGGDMLHLKTPTRNPLWFISELAEELLSFGIPHIGIAGNHDLKFGSIQGLKGQPIEVLVKTGILTLLDYGDQVFEGAGFTLRVAGESYNHGQAEGTRAKKKEGSDFLLGVGHFWFGISTGEFFGEPMYGPDYLGLGEPDAYLIGHHHDDQGIQVIGSKTYIVPGAMGRTGAHHGDMDRKIAASYIKVTKEGITGNILRPKFIASAEALDLEKREVAMKEEKELTEFVESLNETDLASGEPSDLLDTMDVALEVKTRAKAYLEKADAQ